MIKPLPSDRGDETYLVGLERMLDRQRAEDREYLDRRFNRLEAMIQTLTDSFDKTTLDIMPGKPKDKET